MLCSIYNGEPLLACGQACYLQEAYTCVNATSASPTLAVRNTPYYGKFQLQVLNSPLIFSDGSTLNGQTVNARGNRFYIGGAPSTDCPIGPDVQKQINVNCSLASNTTVFRDTTLTLVSTTLKFQSPRGAVVSQRVSWSNSPQSPPSSRSPPHSPSTNNKCN